MNTDALGGVPADDAQAVVRVGQAQPGALVREPDRGAEDDALEQTGVRAVVEEPRPEDDGDVVAPGGSRLGPPGPVPHLRHAGHSPRPPLPAPRLETLIKRPSVTGRDSARNTYLRNKVKTAGAKFSIHLHSRHCRT